MARETEQKVLDPIRARNGVLQVLQDPVKGFYLVATTGDVLIGQCMVTFEWSDWRDGNFWWIQSVYVAIEYRKKGIFTLLYRELERMARREPQVVGLRLYVEQGNDSAVDIYTHLGMKETCYRILEIEFDKP
jgi:Acetyltransferases